MDRWVGRVALVTGASSGFGEAIAKRLTEHGMKVVGCARNIEKIQVKTLFPRFKLMHSGTYIQSLDLYVPVCSTFNRCIGICSRCV